MGRLSDHGKVSEDEFLAYKKRKKSVALAKSIIAFIIFISIGFLVYESDLHTIKRVHQYFSSNIEENTIGTIVHSESRIVLGKVSAKIYFIKYKYSVNNREFIGDLVNYNWPSKDVDLILQKYPVGKDVTVFYDPSKPNFSILENTFLGRDYWFLFIFIPLVSPLIIWGGYYVFYDWVD